MSPKPSPSAVSYPSIRGSLGTGDLIFLHGENPLDFLIEDAEQAVGEAPYSHVGMIIKDGPNL